MEFDQEHIRQLYLQKLTNILTPEEELELEMAMRNPATRRMCRELEELYASPEMQQLLREKPTSARWDELMDEVMQKEEELEVRDMGIRRWLVAACTLLVVTVGLYFLWPNSQQQSVNYTASHKPALHPRETHLKLANEMVPLSGTTARKDFRIGNTQLSNIDNTLRIVSGNEAVPPANAEKTPQFGEKAAAGWATLEVPAGKNYAVILPDGTEVNLNSASIIRFPLSFNGSSRDVEIKGEAYLKVAKNENQPFIVHSDVGNIQVLGTSFNVNTYEPGQLRASLLEGSIRAVYNGNSKVLTPGQQVIIKRSGEMDLQTNFNKEEVLSWMKGIYYFNGSTYASLAKVMERCYDIQVVFDNDEIAGYRYEGKLDKSTNLQDFLEMLRMLKHIEYRLEDGTLHLF